ncbi:DUF1194 domain-containing protein [Rhizobiaceae bacterium]|nr:DUF1194 domain-containing protein [Rhizobiaceae bacterium]
MFARHLVAAASMLSTLMLCTMPAHAQNASNDRSASAEQADMLLCLAADASESVTEADYYLQKNGHASAIRDPEVVSVIQSGRRGRIASIYVEWADQEQQFIAAPWHIIDGPEAADSFSRQIESAPLPHWIRNPVRNTAISRAIRFCMDQFTRAPVSAPRWVIDLSSDGTHNLGASLEVTRRVALEAGVVINALAIINSDSPYAFHAHENPEGGLEHYYKTRVIGGSGAFVQVADGYASFAQVIRRKFVLELSQLR